MRRIACAVTIGFSCVSAAAAQTPSTAPDPYELSDPDRPDVTNGTHIVDVGLLQIEFGGIYTHPDVAQHAFGTPFTARVGLTDWLEARVGTDGLLTAYDHGVGVVGFGNLQVGAKLRLWADPGGVPVLSILPTINLPTASVEKGFGSGDVDYSIAILSGTDIGERGHVDFNYGFGEIGSGGGLPHFAQQLLSVSASVEATRQWNPYAEAFWFSREDTNGGAVMAADAGAIYTVSPRFAIDGGIQFGVTSDAPGFSAFGGISIVVGNILGDHGVHARQRKAQERATHRPVHK